MSPPHNRRRRHNKEQTGTERWQALDFAPPAADAVEPDEPVLLDYSADDHVAVVTLNRPHADNAISTEMGVGLTEILESIAVRPVVRAVVITGGVRAFSVGSDLRQRKSMTKEEWLRQRQAFDRTLYTLRQMRKPVIAAVNGIAYGGGHEIAQSADFIIASSNATFGQPESMIGLSAVKPSPVMLPRLLPPGRAMQILLTGDPITAQEAYRLGMVTEVHDPPDLMSAVLRYRPEDRQQLAHRRAGRQACRAAGSGAAHRAGDRHHDGGALALGGAPGPGRGHRRVQRRPRPSFSRFRLLRRAHRPAGPPSTRRATMTVADDVADQLRQARADLIMINPAPFNAEAPPWGLTADLHTDRAALRAQQLLPASA